jgi:hypothetical protein
LPAQKKIDPRHGARLRLHMMQAQTRRRHGLPSARVRRDFGHEEINLDDRARPQRAEGLRGIAEYSIRRLKPRRRLGRKAGKASCC